jgi:hypothetical protein
LEEVSPDRPPTPGTPDIREEPEDRLTHLIDQLQIIAGRQMESV